MNVNTLRDRIIELSHDEASPDTDLHGKALSWLNAAYRELMDELQPYLQAELQQEQNITTASNGQAVFNYPVRRMVKLIDTSNLMALTQANMADVLAADPALMATGTPRHYWLMQNMVQVYPAASVGLKAIYLPDIADLTEGGTEESVLLPRTYHQALVWGGLVWASVYERGFSAQGDLSLFQQKWDEAKRRIKLSLASRPDKVLRVQAAE
ncbi:MAG: hypothetical protein WAX89_05615 [Alphaproteobacteria bacterium]